MRRVIVTVLIANLMGLGWGASVSAVEAQTGRISGTVFPGLVGQITKTSPCGSGTTPVRSWAPQ